MRSSISMKTGLILLLPALSSIALLWMFSSFLTTVESEAQFTDIAGRQRMLSEQLYKFAYMVHIGQQEDRKELRALIRRFDASLDQLQHGSHVPDSNGGLLPLPPEKIIPALNTVARLWSPLKADLLLVAELSEKAPRARQAWRRIKDGMPELTAASNAVVGAFVTYSIQQHRRMGLMLAANTIFTLLLIIGGFWIARRFIVRPVQQMADAAVSMSNGEYSERLEVRGRDELAGLMVAFNTMADAITAAISRERKLRLRQEAISEAVIGLSRELAGETVLRHVGKLAMNITHARYAMLSWLDEGEKRFIPLGVDEAELAALKNHPPQGLGLLAMLWNRRQIVNVENIAEHPESCGFPDAHPAMRTMLGAPVEFGGNMIGAMYLCDRKDGQPFDAEDENVVRMLASACAVALSNAEKFEHLQQAKAGLEQRVSERTRELRSANRLLRNHEIELELMNDELRHANEAKSQFLANTSHELRTPLNAIIGFSDLLLAGRADNDAASRREYLEYINVGGKQLLTLINSLLDLSKIEAGMLEIQEEPGAPGIALDFTVGQLQSLIENKNLEMHVVRPEQERAIFVDSGKLKQVWTNLIGNAIKFTPEGGRIEAGFNINSHGEETMLEGYVKDTGIGLEKSDIERIFQPFVQAEGGLTREFGGTGLGLALVRRLLEMQGGAIRVESTPGAGSNFIFTLPTRLVSEESETPDSMERGAVRDDAENQPSAPVELVPAVSETMELPLVLIIDDDQARAATVTAMLEEEGYRARIRDMAHVELQAQEACPFLIMIGMPDDPVDIYRRLHLLRSRRATRNIPLVLLGGDAEAPSFSLGVIDTMDKQMNRNELVDMISRHGRHVMHANVMTVLVVDDEASVREYVKESLYGQGYRILLAANGRDGVQAAIDYDPDLIILDLMMPGMSGFEVVEELNRHPTACDIPVIIFTAKDLTREEVMRLGQEIETVLTKGVTGRADLLREMRSMQLLYPVQARLVDGALRCYNIRYMRLRLAQECSRAERYGQPFSLVGWEMDGFDDYLREHGQRWGMAALKGCVELVHAAIRKGDVLVRTGEKTFTLILPGIKASEAERVAEKIRMRVRLHRFPLAGGKAGHLTAAFGCSHYNADASNPDAMLSSLLARVELAKKSGGNCCICFDDNDKG